VSLLAAGRAEPGAWRAAYLKQAFEMVPVLLRVFGAALVLFGVTGLGVTRLALPTFLRRHEPLWILPTGAASSALALSVLGYAHVPFAVSLTVVLLAGVALSVHAVRTRGLPERPTAASGWALYACALLVCVALVPYFRAGFPTVVGEGSDAHLAAGTGHFLEHHPPTAIAPEEPVDRVPLVWRSKPPIYYDLAGVSTLSGLETYETLAPVAALLLGLAALGLFLVATELLGAGTLAGLAAMGLAGLDRMVLHTGLHPYFNQTWGYFAFGFALVLSWWAVARRAEPGGRGGLVLLALFLFVVATAYPLALPIPMTALVVAWWLDRRARRRRGEPVHSLSPKRFWRGPRSLVWMVPLGVLLAIPALGVLEKLLSASAVLAPNKSLISWGGDLQQFIPLYQFFSLPTEAFSGLLIVAMLVLAWRTLRRLERPLAWGLGAVLIGGLFFADQFKHRDYGFYFHFKIMAFVGPLIVVLAAVALARHRRAGTAILAVWLVGALVAAGQELRVTNYQLSPDTIELRGWAAALPAGASIRLDMWPPRQLWAQYMLAARPTCSQAPLLDTDYPRVPVSRRADYIVAAAGRPKPADAAPGPPLRTNGAWRLYRMRPDVPGAENCSQRMISRVEQITISATQ
jgi:disulfide bond formation protein DsbB